MIKILFICHGSTPGSRELAALVGQNGAYCGIWESGLLRVRKRKKSLYFKQCHLDKDDAKNSVCRNMYPVLFLYNFINHLTG